MSGNELDVIADEMRAWAEHWLNNAAAALAEWDRDYGQPFVEALRDALTSGAERDD